MVRRVEISSAAEKQVRKAPPQIQTKLRTWVLAVAEVGLEEVRKRPGFHDEPLKGDRAGQRSIRLNQAWRAIYEVHQDGAVRFVLIEEVNKHRY